MRCSVLDCKHDSRTTSKAENGVTFHLFPKVPWLREQWTRAILREGWCPPAGGAVCSDHFLQNDFYLTKKGFRKVRTGAVPFLYMEEKNGAVGDPGEEACHRVCRFCLAADVKLYGLRRFGLLLAYEELTGLTVADTDRLAQKLCGVCARRLLSWQRFRRRGLRANALMLEILNNQRVLTMFSIRSIDRVSHGLASGLTTRHYDPWHFHLHIDASEDNSVKEETNTDIQPPCEVALTDSTGVEVKLEELAYEDNDIPRLEDDHFANYQDLLPEVEEPIKLELLSTKKSILRTKKLKSTSKLVKRKIDRRKKPFYNDKLEYALISIKTMTNEEQVDEIMKRKDSANYLNSPYKCAFCYKGFTDEEAYSGHILRHDPVSGEFECGICQIRFKTRQSLRKHISAFHSVRYSCSNCDFVTSNRQTARMHDRWHRGTKYQCQHCQDIFFKFTSYMGHLRKKHPSDFVCELCGFSFVSAKGIHQHKKLKHRRDDSTTAAVASGPHCAECDVRFVSAEAHARHLRTAARHRPRDPGADTAYSGKLHGSQNPPAPRAPRLHPRGPITCEQCGAEMPTSRAYHNHFRRAHPDKNRTHYPAMAAPSMCETCGKVFQCMSSLKEHRYLHTGERPYKCELCPKAFTMKQRLSMHQLSHSKARPFPCRTCHKAFSSRGNLQRHAMIHTGLRPFSCEYCDKSFKNRGEKKTHVEYVHHKKPWPKRQRGRRPAAEPLAPPAALPEPREFYVPA